MREKKVLAIKYRPVVLEDLLGQDLVSKTIFNSLKSFRIADCPSENTSIYSFAIDFEPFA